MSEDIKDKTQEELDRELFAQAEKLRLVDIDMYPYRTQEKIIGKYTREQLKKALEAPELDANNKQLRNISKFLYNASSQYKRTIQYLSQMLTFDYHIDLYGFDEEKVNVKKLKKAFRDISVVLENMNMKHEFSKVLQFVFKEGVYFGYKHQNKDDFFLQNLDADYCKITNVESGLFYFAFNFQYFYLYPERLKYYPDEFKQIWEQKYAMNPKKKRNGYFWEDLSSENTICIKADESVWYSIPPLIGIFESLLDISDFKNLQKTEEVIGNYKLITMQIPMDTTSKEANKFLVTGDLIKQYQSNVAAVVPEQIGVATVPMKVDVVNFDRDKIDKNRVEESTAQYYQEAGVSQLLFSSADNGSIGLSKSIINDENVVLACLYQVERWINKFLMGFNNSLCKYRINMPEITKFNRDTMIQTYLSNAQAGMPVKTQLASALGLKPSANTSLLFMENEVLKLDEKLIPLQSSHSPINDKGAPTKNEGDLSDKGAITKDTNSNENMR